MYMAGTGHTTGQVDELQVVARSLTQQTKTLDGHMADGGKSTQDSCRNEAEGIDRDGILRTMQLERFEQSGSMPLFRTRLLLTVGRGRQVDTDCTSVDLTAIHVLKGRGGTVGRAKGDETEATGAPTVPVHDNLGLNDRSRGVHVESLVERLIGCCDRVAERQATTASETRTDEVVVSDKDKKRHQRRNPGDKIRRQGLLFQLKLPTNRRVPSSDMLTDLLWDLTVEKNTKSRTVGAWLDWCHRWSRCDGGIFIISVT